MNNARLAGIHNLFTPAPGRGGVNEPTAGGTRFTPPPESGGINEPTAGGTRFAPATFGLMGMNDPNAENQLLAKRYFPPQRRPAPRRTESTGVR